MAVAVKNAQDTKARSQNRLLTASLVGAVYILGSVAAVLYGVPQLWAGGVTPWLEPALGSFINVALRLIVQVAAGVGLYVFGLSLAGANPPKGLRAGMFMVISAAFTVFFLTRAAGLVLQNHIWTDVDPTVGLVVTAIVAVVLVFLIYRWFTGAGFGRWLVGCEEAGWFDTRPYKRTQGVRTRRLTMLGILILAATGIWTLMPTLNTGPRDWVLRLPFTDQTITLLPDLRYTLPLLLGAVSVWFAYRAVNYPVFADFLVATEAEMNKVTWTTRKKLFQDTVVVLVMVFILTVFLFVADQFFAFALSRQSVGVLPQAKQISAEEKAAKLTPEKQDW
jgi:preprotein translocase SecE subunit